MKYIKTFEKMGIDKLVYDISEKLWKSFLKVYDEKKCFKDIKETYDVDVSEFVDKPFNSMGFMINYNVAYSQGGFPITIGVIDRNDNTKPKSLLQLKREIIHEIQHNINALRRYRKLNKDNMSYMKDKKKFFKDSSSDLGQKEVFNAVQDKSGNIYGLKATVENFLKYNKLSDIYKHLVIYLYLSSENEMSSKLHEIIVAAKGYKKFSDMLEDENKFQALKHYKNMRTFKIDTSKLTEYEINILKNILNKYDAKTIKKLEKYINMKGEKFINKAHKLSYFSNPDNDI